MALVASWAKVMLTSDLSSITTFFVDARFFDFFCAAGDL
eukprot:CAMPEP_0170503752 /NCGR_PEP_ID=MMETSP0208-20121228/45793_1 /TAXON_ID=197538 /ORGANISM="Strombidium inclinatum, Strain S3" /LENGTH=38 /DNA_ID= /DNA_START= /DNA_END= /DNA_ORIENTATION=